MLVELSIRNFALIDDLSIRLSKGLTILSGETGAGKTIIVQAVNLLLGSRASSKLVRTGAQSANIEALFDVGPKTAAARVMAENGLDVSEGLVIRRVISLNDRHRIYINGGVATMQMLGQITGDLASISGQHAHQRLLAEEEHLAIIDQFGALMHLRAQVYQTYHTILPLLDKLKNLNAQKERQIDHIDLLKFQLKEIEAAAPRPGEDQDLAQELVRLKNSAQLFEAAYRAIEALYDGQGAIIERMTDVQTNLAKAAALDSGLTAAAQHITEAGLQLEDVVENLRAYLKTLSVDEHRLETVEERLDCLTKLKRKYGPTLDDVLARLKSIQRELADMDNLDRTLADLETTLTSHHGRLTQTAVDLSTARRRAAEALSGRVEQELATLHMDQTRFGVALSPAGHDRHGEPYLSLDGNLIRDTGLDLAAFIIAPNPGEELKPLKHIVSGGELSRVVLALKAILAETESVSTIVFDEVDAGIGGRVAETVGRKLAELAKRHQIICITHLPQIAKFADHHFRIEKQQTGDRMKTVIYPLMAYDAVNMADWQISEEAEKNMPTPEEWAKNWAWKKTRCCPWAGWPSWTFSRSSIA
jgi:DNA repair protein RecN (Recombination protein N)